MAPGTATPESGRSAPSRWRYFQLQGPHGASSSHRILNLAARMLSAGAPTRNGRAAPEVRYPGPGAPSLPSLPPPPPPGSNLSLLSESAHLITAPPYEMLLSLPHVHLGKLRHGRDSTCPRSRYHQHLDLDTPHFTTRGSLQGSSPLSSWSGGWALPLGDQLERQPVP